ncbi:MAG: restriction endonuclease subunit S [Deltaproteobacteria bacterium]|nr:restriction endonuclease subunit S [Deltaproteobacteria bacterium]
MPGHWTVTPLKVASLLNPETLPEDTDPNFEFVYLDISNVDGLGRIIDLAPTVFATAPSRARRRVRSGDTVFSTVRTYLRAIAFVADSGANLVASTGFAVVRATRSSDPRFLAWYLQSDPFVQAVMAHSEGIGYPAINPSTLGRLPVLLPDLAEQRAITAFLDRETARIDALVEKKRRLIELLCEKRQAVITRAVTRGLDPNVPMTDSGIEWLGRVPAHWDVWRGKAIFTESDERSPSGDEELLTVSHITGVTSRSEKTVYMFEAETTEGYKLCRPGDLAINTMWAWMGALGIAPRLGIVSPSYNVYQPHDQRGVWYFDYLLRTPAFIAEINRWSEGVWKSRLRLYPEAFLEMRMPVPPPEERTAIVATLDNRLQPEQRLMDAMDRSIDVLREHRQALITAAVTGQIDVRNEVPA